MCFYRTWFEHKNRTCVTRIVFHFTNEHVFLTGTDIVTLLATCSLLTV